MLLNKKDWKRLYVFGLIEARGIENWKDSEFKHLNGHVSTTELADEMKISRHRNCKIKIKNTHYSVRYYSCCFYPMWLKNVEKAKSDVMYKLDIDSNKILEIGV
jgi:hypothetical protein